MQPTGIRLAGVVLGVALSSVAAAPRPETPPVKLLLTVAIDGISWPRLEQARPLLGGGLKRMLEEGYVFTRSGYRHLNTETSPGHAALSTGAPPRVTGVVGNRWFVRAPDGTTKVVSSIEQPGPPAVPGQPALALYESGLVDEIVTDRVVTVIADEGLSLGRRLEVDALNVSLAAHDIVAHSYGAESAEADDAIRRVDRQLGRILRALDEKFAPGEVLVALSADHGFSPIPEVLRRAGETRTGGRLVTSDRGLPTFQERLSRMLSGALCLDPAGSAVLATDTSWNLAFAGPFPQRTVEGPCGPSGRGVSRDEMGRAAKRLFSTHFAEEVEEVLLVNEQANWPASLAVEMARNVLDPERIGDVILIPRPHALVHWDPARGSGHGTHHDYDTHVPLIFLGGGFARGTSNSAMSSTSGTGTTPWSTSSRTCRSPSS